MTTRWASLGRFVAFAALTFAAGAIGRATFDETLRISLVWPLYGVVVLWLASGSRRSAPWDALGMSVAVAASVLLDGGSWQQTVVAAVLAAPAAGLWLLLMRRLVPDMWGAGGRRPLSRLPDLVAFIVASTITAVATAGLRGTGLGLVPPASGLDEVLLTAIRNLSWILGLGALGLLLLPHGRTVVARARVAFLESGDRPLLRVVETAALLLVAALLASVAFSPDPVPIAFSLVLVTVWAGFRLPPVGALLLALALGTIGVLATLQGQGAFRFSVTPFEGAAIAQAFL
ncbi:MAG TPA: hypothetical protein VD814_10525, partial [Nocardioides sp.]|nr:hypothetical protein [Nocardioides sp.]